MKSAWMIAIFSVSMVFVAFPAGAQDEESESGGFHSLVKDSYDLGDVTFTVGPRLTQWEWEGAELGPEGSRFLRDLVDGIEDGNKDGQVSESEAEAAERSLRVLVQGQLNRAVGESGERDIVVMDDEVPLESATITKVAVRGVAGAVDSDERVGFDVVGLLKFETRSADVHTLQVRAGSYQLSDEAVEKSGEAVGDFSITITTEKGWSIDPASIQPDCAAERFDDGEFRFAADDLECFRERGGDLIAFSITGDGSPVDNFVPGFESALAALGLLGAVAAFRRRP